MAQSKGKAGRPKKNKDIIEKVEILTEKPISTSQTVSPTEETPKKLVKKQRDLNEIIEVKCIVHGGLYYVTSQGFEIVWANYGDVNFIEYKELIYMMNKYKRFFEEPWVIMEKEVLEDLRVTHYYKKVIDYENIDYIFKKNPEELKKTLQIVADGTKRLIADRATSMIKDGSLDSLKVIEVLQKELNIELI